MFPNITDGIVFDISVEGSLGIIDIRDRIWRTRQLCSTSAVANPGVCIFVIRQRLVLLGHEVQREPHALSDGEALGG